MIYPFGLLGKTGVKQVKHKKGEEAKRQPFPIGYPINSPAVRINWKFYRKELLLLIYEGRESMKYLKIVLQVLLLYGFVLVGGWLRSFFHVPLPGSIIGLLLLWAVLSLKIIRLEWIEKGSYFSFYLLSHFSSYPRRSGGWIMGIFSQGKVFY